MTPPPTLACCRCGVEVSLPDGCDRALGWGRVQLERCVAEPCEEEGCSGLHVLAPPSQPLCPACLAYVRMAVEAL